MKLLYTFFLLVLGIQVLAQTSISTGDPIPQTEITNKDCLDNVPGAVRLLSSDPRVPFAIVDTAGIKSATKFCCEEWASSKKIWYCLNKWGAIVGQSPIAGGEGYDVTQCYELYFNDTARGKGTGLCVSEKVNWEYSDSLEWTPTKSEKKSLLKMITSLEEITIDMDSSDAISNGQSFPYEKTFFYYKVNNFKCIVYGGRELVVAYLNKKGKWIISYLDNTYSNGFAGSYKPIALLDIDQDGVPEIVYQESAGYAWVEKIIKSDNYSINDWHIKAVSVGGATL